MEMLRTPDDAFAGLPDFAFEPHHVSATADGHEVRMHHLDEGDGSSGETILLVHGQPSWSFLYRHVVPPLTEQGHRVVVPDLIGFGKSDKPASPDDFTYDRQVEWLRTAMFDALGLRDVTLYCHDWGGLLALRIVADRPELFARVMIANTGLPYGGKDSFFAPDGAIKRMIGSVGTKMWQRYARTSKKFDIGAFVQRALTATTLDDDVVAAYNAPFPDERFKAGPRAMPQLIPTQPDSHDTVENREAWARLASFDKPFRTSFSEKDATLKMGPIDEKIQRHVAGARGQSHRRIPGAGHFPQEDAPAEVVTDIVDLIEANPRERASG